MRISLEKAIELINAAILPLKPTETALENALGCTLAEDITARINQPPFPRSPYDGYALRSADSAGASKATPVCLKVVGKSYAGAPAGIAVCEGEAVRIMTGGAIPEGADCVIMQEKTDYGVENVRILTELAPRANYCEAGEDFHVGDLLAHKGTVMSAAEYAVFVSAGVKNVKVIPRPWVAIAATGDELQSNGHELLAGQIYNSNSAYIGARLRELAVPALDTGVVGDTLEELKNAITSAVKLSELVITTGGVSVGEKDLVPQALDEMGAEIVFHGVDMKPGMPATLALLSGKPVLALSGNPFAAAVTFELLARPAIARLAQNNTLLPQNAEFRLEKAFTKRNLCPRYQRGLAKNGTVMLPKAQGNGQLRTMMGCNCLVVLPVGDGPIEAGTNISGYML